MKRNIEVFDPRAPEKNATKTFTERGARMTIRVRRWVNVYILGDQDHWLDYAREGEGWV